MSINGLLHIHLEKFCPEIHVTRLQAVMDVATGLQHSKQFSISAIGRHLKSGIELKHRIKKVDRLLSNQHLYTELSDIYAGLSDYVFRYIAQDKYSPIVIDLCYLKLKWSWQEYGESCWRINFTFNWFGLERLPSRGRWREATDGGVKIMQNNELKERARHLRKNMTISEKKLWNHLRHHRLGELGFRRQVILGKYIVDFASLDPKIIIEVDGSQHIDQFGYDQQRTVYLVSFGYRVLRYWNNEVLNNIEAVLNDIWNNCFYSPIRRFAPPSPAGKAF